MELIETVNVIALMFAGLLAHMSDASDASQ